MPYINLVFFSLAPYLAFVFTKSQLGLAEAPSAQLTHTETLVVSLITALNPLLVGPIMYYRLRSQLPLKARTANRISIITLAAEITVGFLYLLLTHIR